MKGIIKPCGSLVLVLILGLSTFGQTVRLDQEFAVSTQNCERTQAIEFDGFFDSLIGIIIHLVEGESPESGVTEICTEGTR